MTRQWWSKFRISFSYWWKWSRRLVLRLWQWWPCDNDYLRNFIEISKDNGNTILVTDYCSAEPNITDSYNKNTNNGYVSFQGDQRDLNNIPVFPNPINNENNDTVVTLSEIQNFLYLINPENFSTKNEYINAINAANYDLLIMDLFFHDGQEFSSSEIDLLKTKANGGKRLLICYMSIGEAEDYRYYLETNWNTNKSSWLDSENPNWEDIMNGWKKLQKTFDIE